MSMRYNTVQIGYTGEDPFLTLYGDETAAESDPMYVITKLDGWEGGQERERDVVDNPNGGSYFGTYSRAKSKQITLEFTVVLKYGDFYKEVAADQLIRKLTNSNKLLKIKRVYLYKGTLRVTEYLDEITVNNKSDVEINLNTRKYSYVMTSKRTEVHDRVVENIKNDPIYAKMTQDVAATKAKLDTLLKANPLATDSEIQAQKVQTSGNTTGLVKNGGTIIISSSNPEVPETRSDTYVIDYSPVRQWIDSDVAETKANIVNLFANNPNPTSAQIQAQKVQSMSDVVTINNGAYSIIIVGSNPGYADYSKTDTYKVGKVGINAELARNIVPVNGQTVTDSDAYLGGNNGDNTSTTNSVFWNRIVINQPGTYIIKQDASPGYLDTFLGGYWATGNISAVMSDGSGSATVTPSGRPLFADDDSNGSGRGVSTVTVTATTIAATGSTLSTAATPHSGLPLTIWALNTLYADNGQVDRTKMIDTSKFASPSAGSALNRLQVVASLDTSAQTTASTRSAQTASTQSATSSSSTNTLGG